MITIRWKTECECGEDAISETLDISQEGDTVEIDVQDIEQMILECPKCGKRYFIGDVNVLSEDDL